MSDLLRRGSAVISADGVWRYRLDRVIAETGVIFLFAGVNGSTATGDEEDHTTMKWGGFALRNGGARYIAVNPFGYRATDVRELASAADPIGPENDFYIRQAIDDADILVPCWGNSRKVPERLRYRFGEVLAMMRASGKPMRTFGFTNSGDPKHPLMLGYDTPLTDWSSPSPVSLRR